MLSVRPLLVLSVLGEAALLLLDDQQSSRALIEELRSRPRRVPPPRKFSVAEIEERQRAEGATVEYLNGDTFWTTSSTRESVRHHEREVAVRLARNEMEHRKRNRGRGDCFHGCDATARSSRVKPEMRRLQAESNTQRCGFSWDDAAAKCGPACPMGMQSECDVNTPKLKTNGTWEERIAEAEEKRRERQKYRVETGHNPENPYRCYADVPTCDPAQPLGECFSRKATMYDQFCTTMCNSPEFQCDWEQCVCEEHDFGLGDPIEPVPLEHLTAPGNMSARSPQLVEEVRQLGEKKGSGLPECTWKPGPGCTNTTPYERIDTAKCSAHNWFESNGEGKPYPASCIHASTFHPAPYYALWRAGPISHPYEENETIPHYAHDDMSQQLRFTRKVAQGDILMSSFCRRKINEFVGVSLYSPKYTSKARRLLHSCERVGVCCKATLLPPDAFGPNAPEGSEEFRFRTIAIKPAFILSQLKATQLPVVFLDIDLEFQQFPNLFTPGSWPNGPRDVAIFNYWGNETDLEHASTPTTGSGVIFFNQVRVRGS